MKKTQKSFTFKNSPFRRFIVGFLRFYMRFFTQIEVIHAERIPAEGAVIVIANHVSSFDAILVQLAIPRPLCIMSKEELFSNPITSWFFYKIGSFPVKRGEFDRQSILDARWVVQNQGALTIFPEGTRTFGKGMQAAHSGAAHIAMRNHCVILPVGVVGSADIHKHGLRKARIQIRFGELIEPGEQETAAQLTDRMMRAVAALLPEKLRGFYA